ncbi:MAG: tyrosine--tRNA ligase [Candidatus Nealsonbacteria bacterium CG23_combo_of_CG06-09_8_20_14_all_39_25]|uniref:Tyrosine--tRNA ligase n=4 Tax=Candidatus Nealsoniibacteriota TaxID=1817911 RepID=A0A2G9YTH9_9BACT|nr:MAG: tyrosine--tRNA ligase [Candidatus Nealsonbacteria bacterium CG23_combo_of_CG06-09_8_20_14_all_39_25]PIQ98524.1 MAG: tyrosine--tRNA ligase [Candidatus Nealsonbacteria bacterium CG11_big_fil_rev_8_21_14_0_20_39_9]PIW90550.1 MAG: tyrosine--tRNA ligase [Candidatus Nealsonbacteria bacterium CG_4_8_14_3_um_filter_40_11]
MKLVTDSKKISEVLTRGVVEVLPSKEALARLMKRQRIRLYLGIDPTAPRLHLGHTIPIRKLQEFAELGHEAILVIGTGTVLAGDPSAREKTRILITEKEIKKNIKDWKKQAGKVLDFSKVKIRYNGDWLLKLKLRDIVQIARHISAIKLFQRDMFQERLKKGGTVWTHETLYPLLQGYDSVALNTDLEIGGTDQVFNMLIGRELQEKMRSREKFVLTTPLVLGIDGKPMSKSSGNCVWIEDSASQMFGKIMSIPDELIRDYFALLTRIPTEEVKKGNPRDLKAKLAKEIVRIYHGEKAAKKAEEEFNKVFREKGLPSKIAAFETSKKVYLLVDLLFEAKLAPSKSEARRVILQGGAKIDGKVKKDWKEKIKTEEGMIIQVGKRKFLKIKIK